MANTEFRSQYEKHLRGLSAAVAEQEKIEKKIMAYRRTLSSLADLCKESGEDIADLQQKYSALFKRVEGPLTDEIRKILKTSPDPVTTHDVRHALRMLNYDLTTNRNPLATINAILNRLVESKEAKEVNIGGRKAWKRIIPFTGNIDEFGRKYERPGVSAPSRRIEGRQAMGRPPPFE